MQPTNNPNNGATASLVLGISAIITAFTVIIGLITGILAIIFGVKSIKQQKNGKSIAGIITGSVGILLSISMILFWFVFLSIPALQRNQRDIARKNDMGLLVSNATSFQANNRGQLPTAGEIDTTGLTQITTVTEGGSPAADAAVYTPGITCNGASSERAFSIATLLEDGSVYCLDS